MELDITHLVARKADMIHYSASIAELGENAGKVTWENALDCASESPLVPPEGEAEARDYIREFGAWEDEEIDGWDSQTLNALVLQLVAGDIRDMSHYGSYAEYAEASGRVYQGDDSRWYYYLGM